MLKLQRLKRAEELWLSLETHKRKDYFKELLGEQGNNSVSKSTLLNNYVEQLLQLQHRQQTTITKSEYKQTKISKSAEKIISEYIPVPKLKLLTSSCYCDCSQHPSDFTIQNPETHELFINLNTIQTCTDSRVLSHIHYHLQNKLKIQSFYKDTYNLKLGVNPAPDSHSPIPSLPGSLLPHQRNTVQWMTSIENNILENTNYFSVTDTGPYETAIDNTPFFVNTIRKDWSLSTNMDKYNIYYQGGILGDEPGIGKTLCMLQCIYNNPCTLSIYNGHPQYNKATLIFMPSHLINQWMYENETKKLNLKIITLCTAKDAKDYNCYASEQESVDIILVSFQFLLNKTINKQFLYSTSWYRVGIDEGHELLSGNYSYKLFQFINHIKRIHSWFISGSICGVHLPDIFTFLQLKSVLHPRKIKCTKPIQIDTMYTIDIVNKNLVSQITKHLLISHDKSVVSLPNIRKIIKLVQLNELELNQYAYIKSISKYQRERLRQLCCHMQLSDQDTKHFGSEVLTRVEIYNKLITSRETDMKTLLQMELVNPLTVLQTQKKHDIEISLEFMRNALTTYTSEDCPICMEPKKDSIINKCGHTFCSECIYGCIRENGKCPMCRTECTVQEIIGIKEDDTTQINIGSKLQAVLDYIQNEIPSHEKILIFCEWNKLLKKMTELLNKHNVSAELCDGSIFNRVKCIKNFEGDGKVLALSSLNMASGLNLTVANHLIFLNVSENKVQETQAIARVHRLGQKRDITIAYFIAKGTVEEENFTEIEL